MIIISARSRELSTVSDSLSLTRLSFARFCKNMPVVMPWDIKRPTVIANLSRWDGSHRPTYWTRPGRDWSSRGFWRYLYLWSGVRKHIIWFRWTFGLYITCTFWWVCWERPRIFSGHLSRPVPSLWQWRMVRAVHHLGRDLLRAARVRRRSRSRRMHRHI